MVDGKKCVSLQCNQIIKDMKTELLNKFILNTCIENYIPLYNLGIKMFERYGNDWHEVVTYKSDFSDIDPHHFIYNSPNVDDIGGIYVSRK